VRENDRAGVRKMRGKKCARGHCDARVRPDFDARIKRFFNPREQMRGFSF
jgi:hypothetical protein